MTYKEAVMMVKGKTSASRRKIGNNTYATIQPDGSVAIRLHSTDVVTIYPDDAVKVNSGGWRTSTTKDRINKYSPVKVYQKNHQWYFDDGSEFEDGMIFKVIVD
jgi:hypothetical protein